MDHQTKERKVGAPRQNSIWAALGVLAAALAAAAIAPPGAAGGIQKWNSLAREIAAPWPPIQGPAGNLPDYLDGIVGPPVPAFVGTRYGDAFMGFALMQVGAREGDEALTQSGIRAVSYATAPNRVFLAPKRPSVFENWAVAEAYNLAQRSLGDDPLFRSYRGQWENWLRQVKTVRLGNKGHYGNHWLVDALAVAALLRTGLTSTVPGTVLGSGRTQAARDLRRLVNKGIPHMAPPGVGPFVLSDLPDNPAAYQALSLGFYARLVETLGSRASSAARRLLLRVAKASWLMAAPDGDQAYFGRSQEEVWAYTAAAYGSLAAARLSAGVRAARYRALADRSISMLRRNYPVSPRGQLVIPALAQGLRAAGPGLDVYAGAPSMGGIALVMLNFAIDDRSGKRTGRLAADRSFHRRLSTILGVVRSGRVWYAVKLAGSSHPRFRGDLRYDFGLIAAKRHRDGGWTDIVPLRPRTISSSPDSAGPILRTRSGRTGFPAGRRMRFARGGVTLVSGWFRTASGRSLRRARFRYTPTRCGVALSFQARRGDHYELSYFFKGEVPRRTGSRALVGPAQRIATNIAFHVRFKRPYVSGAEAGLVRARLKIAARRTRIVRVRVC
jgi:hypothetical protein